MSTILTSLFYNITAFITDFVSLTSRFILRFYFELGLSKGSDSLALVIKTDKTMNFSEAKEALWEPTRPPVEEASDVNGAKKPTILEVLVFKTFLSWEQKGLTFTLHS